MNSVSFSDVFENEWLARSCVWHSSRCWMLLRSWYSSVNHTSRLFSADNDCYVASAEEASCWCVAISLSFVCVAECDGPHWGYDFWYNTFALVTGIPAWQGKIKRKTFSEPFHREAHALQQSRAWSCLKEGIRLHCSAVLQLNSGINWKLDNLLYQEQIAEFMWCTLSFKRFQFGLCTTWYKEVQDVVRLLPQPQKILGFPDPKLRCWGFLRACSACKNSEVVLHSR